METKIATLKESQTEFSLKGLITFKSNISSFGEKKDKTVFHFFMKDESSTIKVTCFGREELYASITLGKTICITNGKIKRRNQTYNQLPCP